MLSSIFLSQLSLLKAMIIILGLGHFTVAYIYAYMSTKKKSNFIFPFVTVISFIFLSFFSSIRTEVFLLIAVFLFTVHHAHDMYKIYLSKIGVIFWLLYGSMASYFIYQSSILKLDSNTIPVIMFWLMTLHHYFVWYFFYYRKFQIENKKLYIQNIVVVHLALVALFFISTISSTASILLDYRFFYLQTIGHISFSYYKYWC